MFCCNAYMQQMSATFPVILEAESCLEGYLADGKADPPVFHQLGQVSFMQYFGGATSFMDHLEFLEKFLPQWLHWAGKQGRPANGR